METTTDLVRRDDGATVENALLRGDLSHLSTEERLLYYRATCESLKLNPLTKPFDYLELEDKQTGEKKLILYAKRDCTDQLRKIHSVNIEIKSRELIEGVYVVTARATTPDRREDEAIGAVPLVKENGEWKTAQSGKRYFQSTGSSSPLSPDARANAIMKAETKAKRRVTLSICGLGLTDESELESLSAGQPTIDTGGHAIGTQGAANYVRDRKLAEPVQQKSSNGVAAADVPAAVAEMYQLMISEKHAGFQKVFDLLLEAFTNIKGSAQGREVYNQVLGLHGVDRWQNFKSLKEAQKCVLALYRRAEDLSADAERTVQEAGNGFDSNKAEAQEMFA